MGVIYLVRHGQANPSAYGVADSAPNEMAPTDDSAAAVSDPGPGLTDTGRVQAGLTGTLLSAQISGVTAAISGEPNSASSEAMKRNTMMVISSGTAVSTPVSR